MNSVLKLFKLAGQVGKLAITRPGRLSHVLGVAAFACEEVDRHETDMLRFKFVSPEELLPEGLDLPTLTLGMFPRTHASQSVLETVCLNLLMKKARARSIFEFGTYKGVSITQLALNLPEDAEIRTLDLPDQSEIELKISDPDELKIAREVGKGSLVPERLRSRIQFLKQDSAKFDPKPFAGKVDFVFVDGAHSYDYVKNDSEKGWAMLRSGGIIAWHDCRVPDPDVVRYLLECPFNPSKIVHTSLAFAVKP
jgi:predicted O-methyltransferase YrrM